jgi:hypothetical protein
MVGGLPPNRNMMKNIALAKESLAYYSDDGKPY